MKISIFCAIMFCSLLIGIVSADTSHYGNWTQITPGASFDPRYDYGVATFNDRLWVIGGHIRNGYFWGCPVNSTCDTNDIWSSADGSTWYQETLHAPFSPRSGMGVVVFNNRLWVIGGSGTNDVWSSDDGIDWVLVTPHAEFSPRGDMGLVVFNDRLWVIGGGTYSDLKNDVWSSSDGRNWSQVTTSAGFSPRYGKGVAVFENKLWIIGGISDSGYVDPVTDYTYISEGGSKDVWSSPDGKTWTLVNENAPFRYQEFPPVTVFENKIWILGGGLWETLTHQTSHPFPHAVNEVWSSTNGANWTLETESAGFSPRFLNGITVFQNGIWVLGGTDNYQITSDIWYMPGSFDKELPTATNTSSRTTNTSRQPAERQPTTYPLHPTPLSLPVEIPVAALGTIMFWGATRRK